MIDCRLLQRTTERASRADKRTKEEKPTEDEAKTRAEKDSEQRQVELGTFANRLSEGTAIDCEDRHGMAHMRLQSRHQQCFAARAAPCDDWR